ncbi:thioredoxin-disulfide reductase [Candidatus Curtissbacteria bacterium RIFCSPLOWO2_01_FULL_37_9]|uniref:Thioredoxin-disulfide reductase n=1 Tax=Candidatus Curtissbacteria bacterium RIFCSPLOWO2_01_FULL_37_9 TaxID=1797724 RepID=A0A1F5GRN4_9BACT|nr:MAG: thioredoxin-disulfide reductase [Candidatus Curtissbacteria bacterium RIFCSPLOWO2_01_FULL_37_9]
MELRKVVIIGSGPAGFTAALYTARANLSPLVFAGSRWGGQLMLTTEVENYPGFVDGILGPDMMNILRKQAMRFGAEIFNEDVTTVDFGHRPFKIRASEKQYQSKAVIIATGAEANWLNLPNEQRLIGKGISSCAPCDAFFFTNKKVVVIGGGDSAMEEALTLTKFATEVTIIHRRDKFRASKIMIDRAKKNAKITFIFNSEVVDVLGKDKVEGVKIKTTGDLPKQTDCFKYHPVTSKMKAGSIVELPIDGVFLAIGHKPLTDIFKGQLDLNENGYIIRKPQGDKPGDFQMTTTVEGVFVAGDVHDYHFRQAVTAAGYGCMAALEVEKWLESRE